MQAGKDLAQRAAQELAASSTTSLTAAGRTEFARAPAPESIDAINQVFALFRLNFHNQYYSAFGDAEQLKQIKKLWLESLSEFAPEAILLGARHCIQTSEYLPTLHRMLECCRTVQMQANGLPDAHAAYLEACRAAEPRHAQHWSHPAVFHAGQKTGWFLLASGTESRVFPLFREHYQALCVKVIRGDCLALPAPEETASEGKSSLSVEEQRAHLQHLRAKAGI